MKLYKTLLIIFISSLTFACAAVATKSTSTNKSIFFTDRGVKTGTPIILIHAFPLNQKMWDRQVEVLKKSFRVITFDIRGLGKSELIGPYTLEFVIDDLITTMNELKINKAVIGGLSMGGFVALRAVERNPEKFIGLVLANTKSEPDSDNSKLGRYWTAVA